LICTGSCRQFSNRDEFPQGHYCCPVDKKIKNKLYQQYKITTLLHKDGLKPPDVYKWDLLKCENMMRWRDETENFKKLMNNIILAVQDNSM